MSNNFKFFRFQIIRTSAKSLAERAGAAQYAVHIEEELSSAEVNSRHELKKRLSDENRFDDSDYEIYQGVVGRPGIDFPILAGIPQTTFNCRKFGNGYFADLETECQVLTHFIFGYNCYHLKANNYLRRYFTYAKVAKKFRSSVRTEQYFNNPI